MSLYGRTDSNANKTKVELTRGNGPASASGDMTVVFVDERKQHLLRTKQEASMVLVGGISTHILRVV